MTQITKPLTVYIPDTRGVVLSDYGFGNTKLGLGVFTYSRLPGVPTKNALGAGQDVAFQFIDATGRTAGAGTCPGATEECQAICYAARPVAEMGPVWSMWLGNSITERVPPIPEEAQVLRLHVSGDFTSVEYIENWIARITARPDVTVWAYTRSWRVPALLPALERLRALPNVQLFASMDASCADLPPTGWRRAWVSRPVARPGFPVESRLTPLPGVVTLGLNYTHTAVIDGTPSYVCPEETGYKPNCLACGYCFEGQRHDVTFLEHHGTTSEGEKA